MATLSLTATPGGSLNEQSKSSERSKGSKGRSPLKRKLLFDPFGFFQPFDLPRSSGLVEARSELGDYGRYICRLRPPNAIE